MFVPSSYQLAIFEAVKARQNNLLVNAVAGSGKSTTLEHALRFVPPNESIVALAFNRSIAEELQRRIPDGALASTLNGVGHRTWMGYVGRGLKVDGAKIRVLARQVVPFNDRDLTADVVALVQKAKVHGLVPEAARAVNAGLAGLMPDTDASWLTIAGRYNIDLPHAYGRVLGFARAVLTQSVLNKNTIDFDDQLYMTIVYGCTFEKFDRIMVDEAQDLSDIQIEMVRRMGGENTKYLFVGDKRQCQPAGTLVTLSSGLKVPIEDLREGNHVASFHRGSKAMIGGRTATSGRPVEGKAVLGTASRPYVGRMLRVSVGERSTEATPDHLWVTRWTKRAVGPCVTYLMRKGKDYRVGWCQLFSNTPDSKSYANHFFHRCRLDDADAGWILQVFDGRTDASVTESIVAAKYGIPTATFRSMEGAQHMTPPSLERIFASVRDEAEARASRALEAFGRDVRYPYYTRNEARSRTTVFETETCNLLPGLMSIPVETGTRDVVWSCIDSISDRHFDGLVYSISVEDTKTYVADGLVTHNCLYQFRGADSRAMDRIQKEFNCQELPLSVTYRCPTSVVEVARRYEPTIEPRPGAPVGVVRDGGGFFDADYRVGDMVVCRRSLPVITLAYALIAKKIKVRVQGRDLAEGLRSLIRKLKATSVPQLLEKLSAWEARQVSLLVASDEEEKIASVTDKVGTLKTVIMSSGATTVDQVERAVEDLFSGDGPCVLLSTVHRAKGLEADRVFVIDNDMTPRWAKTPEQMESEQNIKYVAVTRSKNELVFVSSETSASTGSKESEQKVEQEVVQELAARSEKVEMTALAEAHLRVPEGTTNAVVADTHVDVPVKKSRAKKASSTTTAKRQSKRKPTTEDVPF